MYRFGQQVTRWVKWLCLIVFLAGIFLLNQMAKTRAAEVYRLSQLSAMRPYHYGKNLPPFFFATQSGRHFSNKEFIGGWSLMLVGNNIKKPVAKNKIKLLAQAQQQIKKFLLLPSPTLYVLSPAVDLYKLNLFSRSEHSRHVLGQLAQSQFDILANDLGATEDDLQHGIIALVDPAGHLRAVFSQELLTPRQLVKDYITIIHA